MQLSDDDFLVLNAAHFHLRALLPEKFKKDVLKQLSERFPFLGTGVRHPVLTEDEKEDKPVSY